MESLDENFLRAVEELSVRGSVRSGAGAGAKAGAEWVDQLAPLFVAQAQSRHLDFEARAMQRRATGFYTIGSAGHESNAALGQLTDISDPALLHYRSGGFFAARAAKANGVRAGGADAIREVLRSLTCSAADPISGGRHKVFGHPDLSIIPQTSTIASHLPRAVGLGFAVELAARLDRPTPWPRDAVVICSFGDASVNHSTAAGALNAAAYLTHVGRGCPVLFVCEDNRIGISTRSPRDWPATPLQGLAGIPYFQAEGHRPLEALRATDAALAEVRSRRSPAVLHLRTVRFLGHAGSDVEIAYRTRGAIHADYARDPLLGTARALLEHGVWSIAEVLDLYERIRRDVSATAAVVEQEDRLRSRAEVVAPLSYPPSLPPDPGRAAPSVAQAAPDCTLAQSINRALSDEMERHADVLVFGEDVAVKGGVYGVTRGLQKRFGAARVFDTILDEQTILGTALGAGLAGFVPVPEIQYLAYLHNAEDQLRGEAASLRFFSAGRFQNGMVIRVAGLAYQRGFGGHFHNDNSVAVLRDIPGIVLAVPAHPDYAPALLRACLQLARSEGRVCVYLEPIARYHTRDLLDADERWLAPYDASGVLAFGQVMRHGDGDLLIVTFGNGVHLSRQAAATLSARGLRCTVLDLVWLTPLPREAVLDAAREAAAVLVVDETRATGGVSEAVIALLADGGISCPVSRATSADSYIPLGPAADTVLLQEDDIVAAALDLQARRGPAES